LFGAGAQRRGDPPPVADGAERRQRPADQVLTGRQVTEVGRGEAEEPLGRGPAARVVDALVGLQRRAACSARSPPPPPARSVMPACHAIANAPAAAVASAS